MTATKKVYLHRPGFTLVELLVVIAIIGVLVGLVLPAVHSSRDTARRLGCQNNLVQLILAVNSYEMAHGVYPPGTTNDQGPVLSIPNGYHHSWISQILPYVEQKNAYEHLDRSVSVYDPRNKPVRVLGISAVRCASSWLREHGYSDYAGVHHDVEAPIDVDNNGVFYLNSRVRYQDVTDGSSQTLFIGEKLTLDGDLGWLSGTRSTLRNTGTPLNATTAVGSRTPADVRSPSWPPGEDENAKPEDENAPSMVVNGIPSGPAAVGGFYSLHNGGANFARGDGSVTFVSQNIAPEVYQRMGHRADGALQQE